MSWPARSLAKVLINGLPNGNCLEAEVTSNSGPRASTFRVTLALGSDTDSDSLRAVLSAGSALSGSLQLEVRTGAEQGVPGGFSWTSEVLGTVDHISYDVSNGLVELEGRDFMSRLIRPPPTQNFVNQTSSEIVATLAGAAGLAVEADATETIVGQFYQLEHSRSSLNAFTRFATSLDIVTYLAQLEGFDCFVQDQTLFFLAQGSETQNTLIDVANLASFGAPAVTRLRFDRRTAFDAGAQITVKSWNSRQRAAVEASFPPSFEGNSNFVFIAPNLVDDAASQRAQTLHQDIVRHGLVVSGELAGYPWVDVRSGLQITNSIGWDGLYKVDSTTKNVSARRGTTQTFVAYSQ